MGAIQNSLNQALGSVAVAGRMIGAEKEEKINRGKIAANEDKELKEKYEENDKQIGERMLANDNIEAELNGLAASPESPDNNARMAILAHDLNLGMKKLKELEKEQDAIRAFRKNTARQMKQGKAWGGNYGKE